jgi:hypothetical protein
VSFDPSISTALNYFLATKAQVSKMSFLRLPNNLYFAAGDSSVGFTP